MPAGDLHSYAVDAEENLEKLATGLAEAQAEPEVVEAVEQMAAVVRRIIKALGKGAEAKPDEPEAEQPPPAQGQPRTIGEATDQTVAEARQNRQGA